MVRSKLPGCKGGKLAGSNRGITLVIVGIDFAEIQGIDVVNKKLFSSIISPNISGAGSSSSEPSHFVRPHRKRSPLSYIAAHLADYFGYYYQSTKRQKTIYRE